MKSMSQSGQKIRRTRADAQPLPENIRSVQPGGGVCYRVELAWGRMRRWWLRTFRPGYVQEWPSCGRASAGRAARNHRSAGSEVLPQCLRLLAGPRPTIRSAGGDRLPVAPWGAAELVLMGGPLVASDGRWRRLRPGGTWPCRRPLVLALILYFFRNPRRRVPQAPGLWVSPADGTIAEIAPLEHDEFVGGPAVRIGIFLSIFNVHLNRSPAAARVIALRYSPGEFLNALRPESALRNENMWIGLEEESRRRTGGSSCGRFPARSPGGSCATCGRARLSTAGHVFGMIKLGSRTELIVPQEAGLEVKVRVGQKVKAGETVVAE